MPGKGRTSLAAADRVAATLRAAIQAGRLMPGEHIRQEAWADSLGVSRVPIREALKMLATEGMLVHDLNRGYFVAKVTADEVRQFYRLRALIEPEVLKSIEWPTPAQMKSMRGLLGEVEGALRGGDRPRFIDANRRLHYAIFELSPQRVMASEVERLWSLCDAYRARLISSLPPDPSRTIEVYAGALDALEKHDLRGVIRLLATEREEGERRIAQTLGEGDWNGVRESAPRKTRARS